MELVIARDFLDGGRAAFLLENGEAANQVEQAAFLEHAPQQHFQLRDRAWGGLFAFDGFSGQEPLAVGGQ